eukprot:UN21763
MQVIENLPVDITTVGFSYLETWTW